MFNLRFKCTVGDLATWCFMLYPIHKMITIKNRYSETERFVYAMDY